MQIADPPALALFGTNVSYSRNYLRDQYLNGLQKFILRMGFLKTNDIVILGKSCKIDVLRFPGEL